MTGGLMYVVLLTTCLIGMTTGEVFSASADLFSTFRLEQQVVNVLGELVAHTEAKLGAIRRYGIFVRCS